MKNTLPRQIKRLKSRWDKTPAHERRDLIAWWLDSRDIGTGLRRGFENLRKLENDADFESIRKKFFKLQLNLHVLYFICATYLSNEIPEMWPYLKNLKKLHNARKDGKLSVLLKAATVLEDTVLPILKTLHEAGKINGYDTNENNIPSHLRELEKLCGRILDDKNTVAVNTKPGRAPRFSAGTLTLISEYFQIMKHGPQWGLTASIASFLKQTPNTEEGLRQNRDTEKNYPASKSADETKTNPYVQLDRALR